MDYGYMTLIGVQEKLKTCRLFKLKESQKKFQLAFQEELLIHQIVDIYT